MAELIERLKALEPTFVELLTISCAPALSLGVLHHGEIIHTAHFGRRDSLNPTPPNDDTIYRVASLTKALTSSAVALLVEEGTLDWDTPIREYLPSFSRRIDEIGQKTTLRDLLSNRTGLPNADYMFGQQHGEFLMPRNEIVRVTTFFEAVRPFREKFFYSQWNYGLVTEVVEAVTGTTLGSYIKENILDPLGMRRTTLGIPDDENVAAGHALRNNGTPCKVSFPDMNDGVGLAGGFAGKSSVKDLLLLYQGLLRAKQDQAETKLNRTPGLPFMHTNTIFSPQIGVGTSAEKLAYCLGLYRTLLPGPLSVASINSGLLGSRKLPIIGKSSPGLEIYHHTGNMPGFLASAFLVPSTQSGVVILANALPFMDPTDLVGQLTLSVLIGEEPGINFVPLAKMARANGLGAYAALTAAVNRHKTAKPPRFPLRAYEGCYWNVAENFCLNITVCGTMEGAGLLMKVQDSPRVTYRLEPYDGDTFYWPPDREKELCEQGMWLNLLATSREIVFGTSEDGQSIRHLMWHHDAAAKPEMFRKRTPRSQSDWYRL
ncbi:hypothetical protein MMC28_007063 [Mycoblastus sanguinarius]|nr:hypothetical protein [Mycoblastus sanguinarius]